MGRQHQFAQQGTGHWWAAIALPARTVSPTLWMNGRFLPEQPVVPQVIERRVSADADIGHRNSAVSCQSDAAGRLAASEVSRGPAV